MKTNFSPVLLIAVLAIMFGMTAFIDTHEPAAPPSTEAFAPLPAGDLFVGAIVPHAGISTPTGYLFCNGQAVSRTTYADLFSQIGTLYGAGNGSTTFNVPDLRGEFIRGFDGGRGVDPGRTYGSSQTDMLESHHHDIEVNSINVSLGIIGVDVLNAPYPITTRPCEDTGGTETRPRNVAFNYYIKY